MKKLNFFKNKKEQENKNIGNSLENNTQDLDIYWNKDFANLLEIWGENHVWNEIQLLLSNCKGNVLDIACGTGVAIKKNEQFNNIKLYGIDISDLFISRAVDKGISSDRIKVGDATKTDFSDDFFDYSYSIGSLEHFTDQGITDFIKDCYRHTKIGSFHMVPISRSGINEGWITPYQSYFNNSESWWKDKFSKEYSKIFIVNSGWDDEISLGRWFLCYK